MFSSEEESYLAIADIEPVKTFLANALNLRLKGDKTQYDLIVNQLKVRDDPETLWKVLVALSSFTYQLTKQPDDFRSLLNCIFGYDWKCDIRVTVAVVNLINQLVSTNSTFLGRAFQLYIKSLLPNMTTTLSTEGGEDVADEHRPLIHRAIKGILVQVPTGRSVLFPILSEFFPHKRFSRNVQTQYTSQLLQICTYEPMLQAKILELIVSKCLEMDVEIVIEDSGDVRIEQETLEDFDLDFDDAFEELPSRGHSRNASQTGFGAAGTVGRRKQLTEATPTRIPAEVAEMADKLDSVLILLVHFCEQQVNGASPSTAPSSGSRDRIFQQLLCIFENNIMSIHKSKFVQFVVFFVASLHAPFAQAVAERLLVIAQDDRASSTLRQSAVMYLASYLSRATFLTMEYISGVVSRLVAWAAAYAGRSGAPLRSTGPGGFHSSASSASMSALVSGQTSREASLDSSPDLKRSSASVGAHLNLGASIDPVNPMENVEFDEFGRAFVREVTVSRHELFYSVVQAACYTLCFYGVNMASSLRDQTAVQHDWETVVCCKFDPLRYCLKSVRVEFIRLAASVGFFSAPCWSAIPADLLYTEVLQQLQAQQLISKSHRASDNATMTTFTTNEALSSHYSAAGAHVQQQGIQSQGVVMSSSGGQKEVHSANSLDSFFPFDPCLLCKLHQVIQRAYREWDGVPGLDDADDEESDFEDAESKGSGIASLNKDKYTSSGSRAIPMRRASGQAGKYFPNGPNTPGSDCMMDAFTTSSLSSVVSSIACTDAAMSIASSAAQYMSVQSPFAGGSYLSAGLAQMQGDDDQPLSRHGRPPLPPGQESEGEDSDHDMHESHMNVPAGLSAGNPGAAGPERFDTNFRRPRFYSIGSTGSW